MLDHVFITVTDLDRSIAFYEAALDPLGIEHDRFYWLKIPDAAAAKAGQKIVATVEGQTIRLEGDVPAKTELRLSDELLDLDQPVTVIVNGKQVHEGKAPRSATAIRNTLNERLDPAAAASAVLVLP